MPDQITRGRAAVRYFAPLAVALGAAAIFVFATNSATGSTEPVGASDEVVVAETAKDCSGKSDRLAERVPFIRTAAVQQSEANLQLRLPGHVRFRDTARAEVRTPVSGRIKEVHVRTGDVVEAGQTLLVIDSPRAAEARLELTAAQHEVRVARAELAREERMLAQGVGRDVDVASARAGLARARAELAKAERVVRWLPEGRDNTVIISAPVAGTVLSLEVSADMIVSDDETLIRIGSPEEVIAVAHVLERDLGRIAKGMGVSIAVPGVADRLRGAVVAVGGQVDDQTRRAPVFVELDAANGRLRDGMNVTAYAEVGQLDGPAVPAGAVLIRPPNQHVVYVLNGDAYEARDVRLGRRAGTVIEILEGLAYGEEIVVEGALLIDADARQLL